MAEVTASSMHDARDAEDTRLLAAGEHGALIESYFETIIQRGRSSPRSPRTRITPAGSSQPSLVRCVQ